MTRRLLLESLRGLRDRQIRPEGVADPDTFMVRAVSRRLPDGTAWADAGRAFMQARLGEGLGDEP